MSRESRVEESREEIEEYGDIWIPKGMLDTEKIPARKGFVQRWIRTKVKTDDDGANIYKKMNEGWKPRLISTVPNCPLKVDFQGSDVIGVHGQVLMERPVKLHEQYAARNRQMTQNQMESVKQDVHRVHEPGSGLNRPEMNINSKVSTGRNVSVADD